DGRHDGERPVRRPRPVPAPARDRLPDRARRTTSVPDPAGPGRRNRGTAPLTPTDPRTDAQLIPAMAEGDRDAFAELYRRHLPWLLVRLSRRCASPELVDEVVQDTFVAVWRSARRWDGRGEVAAWIWGIGIRRLVDALRRTRPPAEELTEFADVEISA